MADNQGTIRDVVDNSGTVVNHLTYSAFGAIAGETDPTKTPFAAYTAQDWDEDLGLYYYLNRFYDAVAQVFIHEDPMRFGAGDVNISRYVGNSPTNFTDPSGLEPNQQDAIALEDFIRMIEKIEQEYPWESAEQILVRARDQIKGDPRSVVSGGSGTSDSPANGKPGYIPWSYIYTEKAGWIDMAHFLEAARFAKNLPHEVVRGFGVGVELSQGLQGAVRSGEDAVDKGASCFTREDLPSNREGAKFGNQLRRRSRLTDAWNKRTDKPVWSRPKLSQELREWFKYLNPKPPHEAPDFKQLPKNELDHRRQYLERKERNAERLNEIYKDFQGSPLMGQ